MREWGEGKMKKHNFYFIGECAIIFALLILIGVLVKDSQPAAAQERGSTGPITEIVETEKTEETSAEEVKASWEDVVVEEVATAMETENMEAVTTETGENITESAVSDNSIADNSDVSDIENKTKVVVFGDSIWDSERGEDGISERVMEQLDVIIYNCAIGGSMAAVEGESPTWDTWNNSSFNGMMYVANGIADADDILLGTAAYDVITKVDFNEVDYVIVSYGLNDYFLDVPVYPKEYYDVTSYVGALRNGVRKMQKQYPNIQFILTSPTYCEWFKGERQYELGTYTEAARSVAEELDLHFLDMYHALGKTPDEKTECLEDGVHLTDEGLYLYSRSVIDYLTELGIEKNK